METLGLLILLLGFIIGFGAVIVIDIHGFLGRKSSYWTEATIRTHKVTKPLIWLGILLVIIGGIILYRDQDSIQFLFSHLLLAIILISNGIFLSFKISPYLLGRERDGLSLEILPKKIQNKIMISMIISDIGWTITLVLFLIFLGWNF